jgi:magnesium chelatase family protein
MLAIVSSHAPVGFDGEMVSVEVDIRRGLPGVDLVGLPDNAVRESRERVRVAIRNSAFEFPVDRILVSLAPAAIRKEGAAFDLPIALGILAASGQVGPVPADRIMVVGELTLSGSVRPVRGALAAVAAGLAAGIGDFMVPADNVDEARALGAGRIHGIGSLGEAARLYTRVAAGEDLPQTEEQSAGGRGTVPCDSPPLEDISDIRGHALLKRVLEIAAAGRHHLLLFGPPGSGKTMAARRLPGLLPALERAEALEVTRLHSLAGVLSPGTGLIRRPPVRMPHHSASSEGILGGGRLLRPGEASLAHHGILFLDEAPEFGSMLLQGLREPVEEGRVTIARAGSTVTWPARFQLVLAFNPCPCGNLGRSGRVCACSPVEIHRYWRRMGGALLDRVELRVPVDPVAASRMCEAPPRDEGRRIAERVAEAAAVQRRRHAGRGFTWNARIPAGMVDELCPIDEQGRRALLDSAERLGISSRAFHAVLRIARTIADLEGEPRIHERHLLEAVEHRKYGDGDFRWIRE